MIKKIGLYCLVICLSLTFLFVFEPQKVSAAAAPGIVSGKTYIIVNVASQQVLDVYGMETDSTTNVVQGKVYGNL